jgi:hypothetical protein
MILTNEPINFMHPDSNLPELGPGLRWSPHHSENEVDNDRSSPGRNYHIVASKPGFYSITGTSDGPITFIGGNSGAIDNGNKPEYGSRVGLWLGPESSSEEISNDEDVADFEAWIPYQEVCSSTSRLTRVRTSQPSYTRHFDHLINTYTTLEGFDFVHPSPTQVLFSMLDSVGKYHSLRYGGYIQQLQVFGQSKHTFLDLLRPEARNVLLSGDYARKSRRPTNKLHYK